MRVCVPLKTDGGRDEEVQGLRQPGRSGSERNEGRGCVLLNIKFLARRVVRMWKTSK